MTDLDRRTVLKWLGVASGGVAATSAGAFAAQERGKGEGKDPMERMPDKIETARVRVGHLISDGPDVDLRLTLPGLEDMVDLPAYEGLRYGQVVPNVPADYADFPAGVTFGFRVTPAGDPDTTIVEIPRVEFEAGRNYTLLAIGEASPEQEEPESEALALVDNPDEEPPSYGRNELPDRDRSEVRVVHALPDFTDDFEVAHVKGKRSLGNVKYGESTGYREVDPEDQISIRAKGSTIATIDGGLRPGTKYTAYIASDTPEPGGNKPTLVPTVDAVARPQFDVTLENAFEN